MIVFLQQNNFVKPMYLTKKYCKESGDWLQQSKAHEFIFVALQNIQLG